MHGCSHMYDRRIMIVNQLILLIGMQIQTESLELSCTLLSSTARCCKPPTAHEMNTNYNCLRLCECALYLCLCVGVAP